jgi:HK97 family phage portal protein
MWIERYEYDDGTSRLYPVPVQDVIHLRWPSVDLLQPWQALPPLAAVAADVDAGNEAIRYIRALLKNDATPRVVLTTPTGAFLSDETVARMKEQWGERYGGDQRGSVAVLEEGVTLQRLSLDMSEMAFEALMRVPETHIAAAFRIPPIIAGIGAGLDASTYSNYAEARQAYTQQTLNPLWAAWGEEIDAALAQPVGLKIAYDLRHVAAMRENQNALSERTINQWTTGLMTRNEARRMLGLPEDPAGDVYAMPANLVLIPQSFDAPEPEEPEEEEMPDDDPDEPDDLDDLDEPEQRAAPVSSITPAREYVPPQIDDVAMSISRRIRRYLSEQYRRAADALRALEPEMATRALEDQLPLDFGDSIAEIMRQFYPLLLERSWDNAVTQIGIELAFDLENPKVQEVLHLLALEVRGVSDTTRDEIRGIVGRMASEGISYDAAALEIVQLAGIHSEARARTIAVTESARAWTQGSILAWTESGEVDRMEWSAEPDCCPICRAVNGTVVPLGSPFQGLMPPAHPNCRCALLPVLTDA